MTEGLDFSGMNKEQVEAAFAGLPKDQQVLAIVEAINESLKEAKDFEELIDKMAKWGGIALRIAGKLV